MLACQAIANIHWKNLLTTVNGVAPTFLVETKGLRVSGKGKGKGNFEHRFSMFWHLTPGLRLAFSALQSGVDTGKNVGL